MKLFLTGLGMLAVWNLIAFLVMGIDKRKARKGSRRISERTLLTCAFLMGGVGTGAGMLAFHHKTLKWKFRILVPLAILWNAAVIVGAEYLLHG